MGRPKCLAVPWLRRNKGGGAVLVVGWAMRGGRMGLAGTTDRPNNTAPCLAPTVRPPRRSASRRWAKARAIRTAGEALASPSLVLGVFMGKGPPGFWLWVAKKIVFHFGVASQNRLRTAVLRLELARRVMAPHGLAPRLAPRLVACRQRHSGPVAVRHQDALLVVRLTRQPAPPRRRPRRVRAQAPPRRPHRRGHPERPRAAGGGMRGPVPARAAE